MRRIGFALLLFSGACRAANPGEPADSPPSALVLEISSVSLEELVVTAERQGARATIVIEHPPTRAPNPNAGYLPDADLGPAYVYLLLDRRGQLVSMGGVSHRNPEHWQELATAERTRTAVELDADLQVIADAVISLQGQPRGTEDYRRELADMLRTARELKGLRAPTEVLRGSCPTDGSAPEPALTSPAHSCAEIQQ